MSNLSAGAIVSNFVIGPIGLFKSELSVPTTQNYIGVSLDFYWVVPINFTLLYIFKKSAFAILNR